jgi:ribosome-associated protein
VPTDTAGSPDATADRRPALSSCPPRSSTSSYRLGWSTGQVGVAVSVAALSGAATQVLLADRCVRRLRERRTAVPGSVVWGATLLPTGLTPSGWLLYPLIAVGSLGGLAGPPVQSWLSRAAGRRPGVNTADSRVELSWDLVGSPVLSPALKRRAVERLAGRLVDGVLALTASEHRAQLDNRRAAADRLAALVRDAIAPPPRRPTKPSRGAVARRLAGKRRRGDIKRLRHDTGD